MARLVTGAEPEVTTRVSTGTPPEPEDIIAVVQEAHRRYRDVNDGTVASYIPALAAASAGLFGVCVAGPAGRVFGVGDVDVTFSIQSVSKAFVYALLCDRYGPAELQEKLGANNTGQAFDSVIAVELSPDRLTNAMVNSGAIAATSLAPGESADQQWAFVQDGLSAMAGRQLTLNQEVFTSESGSNQRNRGLAHLLYGYGLLYCPPEVAVDTYTRQCSLDVTATDLAVMGATLANGGRNPRTGVQVVSPASCERTLAIMAACGLYERSGDWLFEIGLPGKSGVSGGIVTVAPGKGGLATYSPRLDAAGNSVRGQLATAYVAHQLGLSLFASAPPAATAG